MRSLPALLVLALPLAACGSSDDTTATEDIDRDAWRVDLVQLDGTTTEPDLDTLERVTRDMCDDTISDLALGLSLEGARPDVIRINMRYVCPDRVGNVDKALEQIQDASSNVDEACALPESQRTEEQSMLAEAMSC